MVQSRNAGGAEKSRDGCLSGHRLKKYLEMRRLELLTPYMRSKCSTS
jgi:hypothetical protein